MATNTNTKISNNPPSSNSQMADQSRLCGLKRGLRKTKDELFQEFCRRAGMRSKPKNIYYISGGDEAEEEEQEDQAKREEVPDDPHRDDDDDADGDDHGFRQFNRMEEEHLYVVGGEVLFWAVFDCYNRLFSFEYHFITIIKTSV